MPKTPAAPVARLRLYTDRHACWAPQPDLSALARVLDVDAVHAEMDIRVTADGGIRADPLLTVMTRTPTGLRFIPWTALRGRIPDDIAARTALALTDFAAAPLELDPAALGPLDRNSPEIPTLTLLVLTATTAALVMHEDLLDEVLGLSLDGMSAEIPEDDFQEILDRCAAIVVCADQSGHARLDAVPEIHALTEIFRLRFESRIRDMLELDLPDPLIGPPKDA